MGDIYDQSYNNPYHFNRHSLGDQYKLNIQHSNNNQNWFSGGSNSYGRSNGSILRDSARFVLPSRNDYNSFNSRSSNNYSQRTFSEPKNYNSNNKFSIENPSFNNREVTNFRNNNLPTFNTREIRKNAESEYRSEYVPYSPEYYQPLRQKPRTMGRRLEVGRDYVFRNEEQKKSSPIINYGEYRIPSALKKKLQLLDSDLVLDDDFEIPDISETNFNEKHEIEKDEDEEEKEKKEEVDEEKKTNEEPFVQPYIEDVEVDNANEFEKDEEDEKPEVCEKPEEVEKPDNVYKLKDIQKPTKGNIIKPSQADKTPISDSNKGTGKPNVNLLPQNEDKGKMNEDIKPDRFIEAKFDLNNETIKEPEEIPLRAVKKVINKQVIEDKPKDINDGNEDNDGKPKLMEKPIELIQSVNIISKPDESEKPEVVESNFKAMNKQFQQDTEKKPEIEPTKQNKPVIIEKEPEPEPVPTVVKPNVINKQTNDIKSNDIPIQQIENEPQISPKPEELLKSKTIIKPSELEKPKEIETSQQITKSINPDPEKKVTTESTKPKKTEEEPIIPHTQKPNIIEEQKKGFNPYKAEYTDYEQVDTAHKITSADENAVERTKPNKKPTTPKQPSELEEENIDETLSGIIQGIPMEEDDGTKGKTDHVDNIILQPYEEIGVGYVENTDKGTPVDIGGPVKQQKQTFKPEEVGYDDGRNKGTEIQKEPQPVKKEDYKEQKADFMDKDIAPEDSIKKNKEGVSFEYYEDQDSTVGKKHKLYTFLFNKNIVHEYSDNESENEPDETYSGIIVGIKPEDKSSDDVVVKDEYPVDNYLDKEDFLRKHYIKTYAYPTKQPKFEEQEINFTEEIEQRDNNDQGGVVEQKKEEFEPQNVVYDDGKNTGDKIDQGGVVKKKKEKFEPQSIVYDDGKNTGDKVDQGGVVKKKKEKFEPQSVVYDDGKNTGDKVDQGGVAKKKKEKFVQQNVGYDDGKNTGDKVDQGGVVKKKKEKFEPQSVGYDDGKNTGDNIDQGGVAEKKKEKFEPQSVGYIEDKFSGDDNGEAGVAETNKIDPNQPDFIISGIIPGVKEKNIIDDEEDNYPLDYYLDEDENLNKHNINTLLDKNKDNDFNESGIIYGQKPNFESEEVGYQEDLLKQPEYETEKYEKDKFKEEEVNYEDKLIKEPEQEPEKEEKEKFVPQEVEYEDKKLKQPEYKKEKQKKKKEKFVPQEVEFEDKKLKQPEYETEKYKKKKEKFVPEEVEYEDKKLKQPEYDTEKYKKDKFKEEEFNYEDNLTKQPEFEPEKIDENQPDYIISGLIPGIGKKEEDDVEDEKDDERMDYYLDEAENLNKHNINTHTKKYVDDDAMSGIIYGIRNDSTDDNDKGHNYAGNSNLSDTSSLSQIYVDYSFNIDNHNYFE